MSYLAEQLLENLRAARLAKGLSQRELSARSGVPQSHISKIESGSVDLRVSSLIVLARVLELEVLLTPKQSVPGIQAIIRSNQVYQAEDEQLPPAYCLDGDTDE